MTLFSGVLSSESITFYGYLLNHTIRVSCAWYFKETALLWISFFFSANNVAAANSIYVTQRSFNEKRGNTKKS